MCQGYCSDLVGLGGLVARWANRASISVSVTLLSNYAHQATLRPTGPNPPPFLRLPFRCHRSSSSSIARPHPDSYIHTWTLPLLPTLLYCFALYSISQLSSAQRAADALELTIVEVHSQTSNSRTTCTRLEPQLRGRESYASRRTKSFTCQTFFTVPSSKSPPRTPNHLSQKWTSAHRP